MKITPYNWFEVTVRYYNPAHPVGMTTETIALEAKNFSDAENRARDLYKGFRPCEIQSITPALYEDVLFSDSFSEVQHWYLVEFEEDEQMLSEYYQYLKNEGCNCAYLGCCSRSNANCKTACRSEIDVFNGELESYSAIDIDIDTEPVDNCNMCKYRGYQDYTHNGNIRTVDYLNTPTCFRFAGATSNKAFILVEGRDFTHVLKRVKEYIYDSILDYNIFAIMQTHLCDVILHDRCQL